MLQLQTIRLKSIIIVINISNIYINNNNNTNNSILDTVGAWTLFLLTSRCPNVFSLLSIQHKLFYSFFA